MQNQNYQIRKITIDTINWSTIVVPIDCSSIRLSRRENDSFYVRSDQGDSLTEIEVGIGQYKDIKTYAGSFQAAFPTGSKVCFVLAKNLIGTIVAEYIR